MLPCFTVRIVNFVVLVKVTANGIQHPPKIIHIIKARTYPSEVHIFYDILPSVSIQVIRQNNIILRASELRCYIYLVLLDF